MPDAASDPTTLFHYTDAAGLLGIVRPQFPDGWDAFDMTKSIKFLASDVRFMNDHAELRFAGTIFAEEFVRVARTQKPSAPSRRVLETLAEEFTTAEFYAEPVQVFATCLSTQGDLLSQWRGYAGGTGGYSIGISVQTLRWYTHSLILSPLGVTTAGLVPVQPQLVQVKYGEQDVRGAASEVALSADPSADQSGDDVFWTRWNAVARMATFKDDGFEEEQEWRLIHFHAPNSQRQSLPVEFRQGRFGLVPYVSLAVNVRAPGDEDREKVHERPERTIERLIVGPSPDQALRVVAARQLLETYGHDPSVVGASPLPFRG